MSNAAHDRAHRGQFFLILRRHTGHVDGPTAVRTRGRNRRCIRFIDLRRTCPAPLPTIGFAGLTSRTPAASLRSVLGERGRLPATRPARRVELSLKMFASLLPAIPLLPQFSVLLLQLLNAAGIPRIPLGTERILIVALSRRPHAHVSAGMRRTCSPVAGLLAGTR